MKLPTLIVPWLLALCCVAGCDETQADEEDSVDGGAELGPDYAPIEGLCSGDEATGPFVICVEDFSPAADVSFGHGAMPGVVMGAPMGAGPESGSTDVVSLGCGGSITLAFGDDVLRDGPGPDFIVFENAFTAGSIEFVEPAKVLVSDDGEHWRSFPCEPTGEPEAPSTCAGLSSVSATDAQSALDPESAGGDAFDLAEVGLSHARFVRIVDRTEEHYGTRTWCEGAGGGFDLDAVVGLGDSA